MGSRPVAGGCLGCQRPFQVPRLKTGSLLSAAVGLPALPRHTSLSPAPPACAGAFGDNRICAPQPGPGVGQDGAIALPRAMRESGVSPRCLDNKIHTALAGLQPASHFPGVCTLASLATNACKGAARPLCACVRDLLLSPQHIKCASGGEETHVQEVFSSPRLSGGWYREGAWRAEPFGRGRERLWVGQESPTTEPSTSFLASAKHSRK